MRSNPTPRLGWGWWETPSPPSPLPPLCRPCGCSPAWQRIKQKPSPNPAQVGARGHLLLLPCSAKQLQAVHCVCRPNARHGWSTEVCRAQGLCRGVALPQRPAVGCNVLGGQWGFALGAEQRQWVWHCFSQHGKQMFPSKRQLLHAVSARHKAGPAACRQSGCPFSSLKGLVGKMVLKHSPEVGVHGWHCVNGLSHPAVASHKNKPRPICT